MTSAGAETDRFFSKVPAGTTLNDYPHITCVPLGGWDGCNHDFKEYMVNMKLYQQCTRCHKKIHIKDLRHWIYNKKKN